MSFAIRGPFDRVEQSNHPRTVRPVSRNEERTQERKPPAEAQEPVRKSGRRDSEERSGEEKTKRSEPTHRHIDFTA